MKPHEDQSDLAELRSILAEVGPAGIWRPVYDREGRLLAGGVGDPEDGLADELPDGFFKGRRVVDIGCNFGMFSFMTARRGALHVLGVDIDERIVRGCRILKRHFGIENVDFLAADLRQLDTGRPFDVGLMIDFIGKTVIESGFLPTCLGVLELLSGRQMLLSIRPVYDIGKHLGGDRRRLRDLYPPEVVTSRRFLLLDYVKERFRNRWTLQVLSAGSEHFDERKQTVLFERR